MDTQISIRLDNQTLKDLFTTAYEYGIGYWAHTKPELPEQLKTRFPEFKGSTAELIWEAILDSAEIEICDNESSDTWNFNLNTIVEGTNKFAMQHKEHFSNALTDWDAETADVWFQMCSIGELTFG